MWPMPHRRGWKATWVPWRLLKPARARLKTATALMAPLPATSCSPIPEAADFVAKNQGSTSLWRFASGTNHGANKFTGAASPPAKCWPSPIAEIHKGRIPTTHW